MTSIRQSEKKKKKKFVVKDIILDERRKRHYSRVYKRFHNTIKMQLSDMRRYDDFLSRMADKVGPILELLRKEILNGSRWLQSDHKTE